MEDASAIARFHVDCWTDAYRGIVPDDVLLTVDLDERAVRWRHRLGDGRRSTLVAEVVDQSLRIVGFATWGESHDAPEPDVPTLELASLYVAREHWGSGLAGALVEHAIGRAPAQLWVYVANARARAFYEKLGFETDGCTQVDEATGVRECRYVRR